MRWLVVATVLELFRPLAIAILLAFGLWYIADMARRQRRGDPSVPGRMPGARPSEQVGAKILRAERLQLWGVRAFLVSACMVALLALLRAPLWAVVPAGVTGAMAVLAYVAGEAVKTWVYIRSLK
jgi:hypothetical protein